MIYFNTSNVTIQLAVNSARSFISHISIHLMLLFNVTVSFFRFSPSNFNTSNVTIQLNVTNPVNKPFLNFNTSNVTIQPDDNEILNYVNYHFNTSNVTIQQVDTSPVFPQRLFQYI